MYLFILAVMFLHYYYYYFIIFCSINNKYWIQSVNFIYFLLIDLSLHQCDKKIDCKIC